MSEKRRTAFITGANRGIGQSIVVEFAKNNVDVIAHARIKTPDFLRMCKNISSEFNINVIPVFFDMTDYQTMKQNIRNLIYSKVPVNILVNNAGVAHGGLFQMTPVSKIKEVFNINLFAQMELTQLLIRHIQRSLDGCVINIGSILGLDLPQGSCAYGLSKAALMFFTKVLAAECGGLGIRVNAVAPGLVNTQMANLMEKKAEEAVLSQCALKRRATPEEIAKVVVMLASSNSSFVNGQIIRVDGGKV